MAGDRFCPLCDAFLDVDLCPSHGVPTIAKFDVDDDLVKLEVGTVLAGRYRVERFMRQGGMGVVLLARQLESDRSVVLKVLKNDRSALRNNLRRFYQEARVVARVQHPNIVRLLEFGFDVPTRVPFLAMELVEGLTIREIVKQQGPIPEERCAAILAEVARALVEAHDRNVLHRDLKPANIMVVPLPQGGEDVKVLDFGLAKVLEPEEGTKPFTAPGQAVGTPAFMAPEQITQSPQDFRTDLYGLGCVMHVMLTGMPPFDGPDRMEVMRRQIREMPPELPDRLADGQAPSPELISLHKRLLAKNRIDRAASTAEIVRAFERLAGRTESEIRTETMDAIDTFEADEPRVSIPDAKTIREDVITQPELEAVSFSNPSDSKTRLLERRVRDPSERSEFSDEDEAWTSVLPSSMQSSEASGTTPLVDSGEKSAELPVHDMRAMSVTPLIGTQGEARPKVMPSVGAIVEIPKTRDPADLERKILIAIAIVSALAILLSVFALVTRDDYGATTTPSSESKE